MDRRQINLEYRRLRKQALADGQRFPSYFIAMARLRQQIADHAVSDQQAIDLQKIFSPSASRTEQILYLG